MCVTWGAPYRIGPQTVSMLRHDLVALWLAGVQGRAVSEDVRLKLKQFPRACQAG